MNHKKPINCKDFPATVTYINGKKHVTLNVRNSRAKDWIDKQELWRWLHIADRTLHSLRKKKTIPFSKLGGKLYYYVPGILHILEQNLTA